MLWFGKAHGAPYESDTPHVPTPVNSLCTWCNEPIGIDDDGLVIPLFGHKTLDHVAYHYECHLRVIIGGVNHQLHLCCCAGCAGVLPPDPPQMTRREAARAAVETSANMRRQLR